MGNVCIVRSASSLVAIDNATELLMNISNSFWLGETSLCQTDSQNQEYDESMLLYEIHWDEEILKFREYSKVFIKYLAEKIKLNN